jgi:uncharacterized protein
MQSTGLSWRTTLILSVVALLVVLAVTLGIASFARAGSVSVLPVTSQQSGIAVCGHGKVTAAPDQASITVGIQVQAATAEEARSQSAQTMGAVINALKKNGIADKDIKTAYLTIQPRYSYSNNQQTIIGYEAENSVEALIRKIGTAGTVIDAVTQAGGNQVFVSGVNFSLADPSVPRNQAQQMALADAHTQAQQLASAAGVTLGQPVSIQTSGCGNTVVPPIYANAGAGASTASTPTTPVQPGSLDVQVDVAVVYAIK